MENLLDSLKPIAKGGLPVESYLLIGPPGCGLSTFLKHLSKSWIEKKGNVVFLDTDKYPEELKKFFSGRVYGSETLSIIDAYSWRFNTGWTETPRLDSPTALAMAIDKEIDGKANVLFVFDSLTTMLPLVSVKMFESFVHSSIGRLRGKSATSFFSLADGSVDPATESFLRSVFDGVFEIKLENSKEGLKRFLRAFSLKGTEHSTNWNEFRINDGIEFV
ncbi:MAG: hypothetical protein HZB68_01500 [Candidatus Aenigmarchaeota archaeon]|nr:hypothetical protein [Candidatus Aenigmarchaeota archaeon]